MHDYRARNLQTERTSREPVSGLKFYTSIATAALATVVGALTGGCDKAEEHYQLPINEETGTELVQEMGDEQDKNLERTSRLQEKARNQVEEFNSYFQNCLNDGELSLGEQKELLNKLNKIGKYPSETAVPEGYPWLENLVDFNCYKVDFGTPEVEKALEKQGIDVEVERHFSTGDAIGPPAIAILGGFVLAILGRGGYEFYKRWERKVQGNRDSDSLRDQEVD